MGFADYIAISDYRATATTPCAGDASATCDSAVLDRIATVRQAMAADFVLLGYLPNEKSRAILRKERTILPRLR